MLVCMLIKQRKMGVDLGEWKSRENLAETWMKEIYFE